MDQRGNSSVIGYNSPEQPLATVGNPAVAPSGAVAEQVLESGVGLGEAAGCVHTHTHTGTCTMRNERGEGEERGKKKRRRRRRKRKLGGRSIITLFGDLHPRSWYQPRRPPPTFQYHGPAGRFRSPRISRVWKPFGGIW